MDYGRPYLLTGKLEEDFGVVTLLTLYTHFRSVRKKRLSD